MGYSTFRENRLLCRRAGIIAVTRDIGYTLPVDRTAEDRSWVRFSDSGEGLEGNAGPEMRANCSKDIGIGLIMEYSF